MPILKGHATEDATKNYADNLWRKNPKISPNSWRIIEGCTVSKIGFGSFRFSGTPAQVLALREALLSGVNLIETGRNFMDSLSEKMVGDVLKSLVNTGEIQREEVMIISQAGYLSGESLLSRQFNKPKQLSEITPHLWHCMHPHFLAEELFHSLSNLGLETIDGYMLQNPEHFLEVSLRDAVEGDTFDLSALQSTFYKHIEAAFTFFETAVIEGKIRFYGISSNTLSVPKELANFIDLAKIFECAQNAAAAAHGRKKRPAFRVIEMPMNMLELGALKNINTQAHIFDGMEDVSTLELASRMHLNVLIKRPLNSLNEQGIPLRLVNNTTLLDSKKTGQQSLTQLLERMIREEEVFNALIGGWPSVGENKLFSFTAQGAELLKYVENGFIYSQMESQFFTPTLALMMQAFETFKAQKEEDEAQIDAIAHNYRVLFDQIQQSLKEKCFLADEDAIKPLEMEIRDRCPENWRDAPLQQIALNAIASVPGVSCVLTSLTQKRYVNDICAIQERGDFTDVVQILGSN